jgi:hypothetical protein
MRRDATLQAMYGRILRVSFEVESTVPKDVRIASSLRVSEAACPPSWMAAIFPHS